jgi:hypothetical protein
MSDSKKWHQRWYVWLIILAVLGSVYSNKDNEDENQVESQVENQVEKEREEAIEIRSSTLYEAYDNNEISADNEYKDKWLKLTGKIIDISINPVKKSETIVKLNGLIDNEYEIIGVPCYFDESQNSEISSLTKGQTVTIIGKCLGKPFYIKIVDCSIEQSVTRKASDNKTSNTIETTNEAKKVVKKKSISGLYMWNGLEYGNFAIFNKDGNCSFGLVDKNGYVNSRTEGHYKINGNSFTVSDLYNPNWEGASKNNGNWKIIGASSIEKSENSLGYKWFKKSRFSDRGTKIEF